MMDLAATGAGAARLAQVVCGPDGAAGGRDLSDPASSGLNDHATFLDSERAGASVRCTGL